MGWTSAWMLYAALTVLAARTMLKGLRRMHEQALVVLVVDDDVSVANAIARLLRTYGHSVHVAYNVEEGLALASKLGPDLILHDLAMPSSDPYEASRRLRSEQDLSETVLIACSASVDEARAREAGFDGWLTKPMTAADLETVITMAQERRKKAGGKRGRAAPCTERK
jgi:CheY-like chemotaxis protein